MNYIPLLFTVLLACAVLVASVCRLIGLHIHIHKSEYWGMFLSMAGGAVFAMHEVYEGRAPTSTQCLLSGAMLYLWVSRGTWRNGPPSFTRIGS